MKEKFYVLPADIGWVVKREGIQKPVSAHKTKEEAIERGIAEARMNEGVVYIRNKNGEDELKKDFRNIPVV